MAKRAAATTRKPRPRAALDPQLQRRVVVERVRPEVDGGEFPIKRVVGEQVVVTADIMADGHEVLAAVLLSRPAGASVWLETPMAALGNDRWQAAFTVESLGRYEYTVEGWIDHFASWQHGLSKKIDASQDVSSELLEGAQLAREAAARAAGRAADSAALGQAADLLADTSGALGVRAGAALADDLTAVMAAHPDRGLATRYERVLEVLVERERARFGAWYEMFPRSAGPDPTRSATFEEAASMLPYVSSLGFDVLYLPPIHPIGRSFRKGRNNTLNAGPDDPGSPWAIGAAEGGHTAVDPGLGTIEDFDRFVAAARRYGLEVALDIAFQASPDHPWVKSNPEFFRHRPDGTIKYAENPPKKYQDIYPINFETEAWATLWEELKGVFDFWVAHGVTIFRVDNPHTKPFRFWHWALSELKKSHPETIFLSEAFTRPKVMRRLAKSGFSQSYTYFTWRNSAAELTEYFTELTQTEVREYMRPNLFANTPDILHEYLQRGGRPAFAVRFVLAATLGASYGIYSGYELSENVPVRPGSEEYLDSEKYQIRHRRFDQPGNLSELIARINEARREHPALQHDWGLRFHDSENPALLCYSKQSVDGRDLILVVVNLDPFNMQHGFVTLPFAAWGMPPEAFLEVHDLVSGERYQWGARNYVRLWPETRAAHVFEVRLPAPLPAEPISVD